MHTIHSLLQNIKYQLTRIFPATDFLIFIIILVSVYLFLIFCRITGIWKKRKCPSCKGSLRRTHRHIGDKLLLVLTFNILPFRRYKCIHCGWEGLRWKNSNEKRDRKYGRKHSKTETFEQKIKVLHNTQK